MRDYPRREQIEEIEVAIEDIDSSLPHGYVPTLIKIDVEGGERPVMQGAIKMIERHRPIVVVEHGQATARSYDTVPGDVFDLLGGRAGLRILDLDGARYDRCGFERVVEQGHALPLHRAPTRETSGRDASPRTSIERPGRLTDM